MKVTKKIIAELTGSPINQIEQVGSKQLFIVGDYKVKGNLSSELIAEFAYSYRTIIGVRPRTSSTWFITSKKFSITTSRHQSELKKMYKPNVIDHEEFIELLNSSIEFVAKVKTGKPL